MIVKLTKDQSEFVKGMSTHINYSKNDWYYIPFWFKDVGDDEFDIQTLDTLPDTVIDFIKSLRR